MANTLIGQLYDPGTAGNILTSQGAGLTPVFNPLTNNFIGYSVQGWLGTLSTTPLLISLNTGGNPSYFAYKANTVFNMTYVAGNNGSTSTTVTFQPYGNVTGGATPGNIGTAFTTASITPASAFVSGNQVQSISLSAGGYVGVRVSTTASNSFFISVNLWVSQAGV